MFCKKYQHRHYFHICQCRRKYFNNSNLNFITNDLHKKTMVFDKEHNNHNVESIENDFE